MRYFTTQERARTFRFMRVRHGERGTSFLDVLVGIGILAIVFWGIVGSFVLAIHLISNARAKAGALTLAQEQVEYVRSLSYDNVGTVGGVPSGPIPQTENITLNGVTYTRDTLIQYVDAPEDGLLGADENSLTTDYKVAKVTLSWTVRGTPHTLSVISNIAPKGIETDVGGGTLVVNVIDSAGFPLPGASVHIVNSTAIPAIDTTVDTNAEGKVIFPGTPEANSYELTATKAGYSTAKTYDTDAINVAPSPGHLSIIAGSINPITFQIDWLAHKTIETWKRLADNQFDDQFNNSNQVAVLNDTQIAGDTLYLNVDGTGNYKNSGEAESITVAPTYLGAWNAFTWQDLVPANTAATYQVLYEQNPGVWAPVPEIDLPGNAAGFISAPVDLSGLDIVAYPALRLKANLSTTDPIASPFVYFWQLSYKETVPLPNFPFTMKGVKTIGTDSAGKPILKYDQALTTDGLGSLSVDLEWDIYTITVDELATGYDIAEFCPLPQPLSVDPGVTLTEKVYLLPHTANSLRVVVKDDTGTVVNGADVRLTASGYDTTKQTSECGQTFFSNLSADTYTLDTTFAGFNPNNQDVTVSGTTTVSVSLTPL